jgi:hypothetical protein
METVKKVQWQRGDVFVMEVKTRNCVTKVMWKGELNDIEVETLERNLKTLIKQDREHNVELLRQKVERI